MPFLIPAVTALISDSCIIWLNRLAPPPSPPLLEATSFDYYDDYNYSNYNNVTDPSMHFESNVSFLASTRSHDNYSSMEGRNKLDEGSWFSVYNVRYLAPLAGLRLVLLIVPLLFHSYTGTALNYTALYRYLYSLTLFVVVVHMVSLALINPTSMESIFPDVLSYLIPHGSSASITTKTEAVTTAVRLLLELRDERNLSYSYFGGAIGRRILLEHSIELRRIWWMLALSFLSTICHWILLWHVRSTAPTITNNSFGNFKRPSVYFAVRTASTYTTASHTAGITTGSRTNMDQQQHRSISPTTTAIVNEQALIHSMNEFVVDMNTRLQRAKTEWATRLEDFGNLISNSSAYGAGTSTSNSSLGSLHQQQQQQPMNSALLFPATVQPFRVLLQLFAYEDVLENRKLDALFDWDDGETITSFVPQLLSFLLHGALYSSPLLEEWILEKCRRNIYFAHRCYWFLRAWCLEAPAEIVPNIPLIETTSYSHNSNNNLCRAHDSNQSLEFLFQEDFTGLAPFLDEPALVHSSDDDDIGLDVCNNTSNTISFPSPVSSMMHACQPNGAGGAGTGGSRPLRMSNSRRAVSASTTSLSNPIHNDKFLPEERAMIERLMLRVKECGEEPARRLEFGHQQQQTKAGNGIVSTFPTKKTNNGASATRCDSSEGSWEDLIVVNNHLEQFSNIDNVEPSNAKVDRIHDGDEMFFDCRSDVTNSSQTAVESGCIPIDPVSGLPSERHLQALTPGPRYGFLPISKIAGGVRINASQSAILSPNTRGATEQFDKTPQFLDSLIFLAEYLHTIPREDRKDALVHHLCRIECELLPSNSVYLPLGSNRVRHSVWRLAAEESIPISTKERVPCIIAVEVVDFSAAPAAPRQRVTSLENASSTIFSVLDRLKNTGGTETDYNDFPPQPSGTPFSSPFTSPFTSRTIASPPDIDFPDSGYQGGSSTAGADSRILHDWVHNNRPPLRRTSLLDKVATTVKAPFDKMKMQVRDHFLNNLRADRKNQNTTEEMQPLSIAREFDTVDSPHLKKRIFQQESDIPFRDMHPKGTVEGINALCGSESNSLNTFTVEQDERPIRSLSRIGSDGSITSLGQWSSLNQNDDSRVSSGDYHVERKRMWSELKRRLDDSTKPPKQSQTGRQLPYGSYHEDESKDGRKTSGKAAKRRSAVIQSNTLQLPQGKTTDLEAPIPVVRPPPIVFRESWAAKRERIRKKSAFGEHPGWKLVPILIKANDDLRQEQLACQLIHRMASILARDKVNVWLCPYEILALTDSGGLIEAIPDTISLDSLKKNAGSRYTNLNGFFLSHFGDAGSEELSNAKANFVESLAAYSIVCFLLQIKDRHNGNILIDNKGHLIHIDFGFFFLSSPGKNVGFESAPFKLTRDFVEVLDGSPDSHLFRTYRSLCIKTFLALRRRCMEIILLVEMLKVGNEELPCFRGRPDDAIQQLRERFRLDLNDRACAEYVNSLIDASTENWRTDWYDRYQRYFVGIL